MLYADANFVVAAHFRQPDRFPAVQRYLRLAGAPILVSDLAEFECRAVFARLEGSADGSGWRVLMQRLEAASGWRRGVVPWPDALQRAHRLVERFAPRLVAGSLDTLHVAGALLLDCTTFLSFDTDSRARVLATSAGLRVWPELSAAEKAGVLR